MDDNFFKNLGELIRYHRKKSGLNRQELANLAGIGKTAIFDIEHGKKSVQIDTLYKVLKILNIEIKFNSPLMPIYLQEQEKQDENS